MSTILLHRVRDPSNGQRVRFSSPALQRRLSESPYERETFSQDIRLALGVVAEYGYRGLARSTMTKLWAGQSIHSSESCSETEQSLTTASRSWSGAVDRVTRIMA